LFDPNTSYSVSGAYHLLTHIVPLAVAAHNGVIWNKIAPLKVSLFAWRLLNNRLPTKDNLFRRGMTHLDSIQVVVESLKLPTICFWVATFLIFSGIKFFIG
jgi:hypothetical protein